MAPRSPTSARIALATCRRLPDLDEDDHPLRTALSARGHRVVAAIWDDPGVDWTGFDLVVLRSTWDYHHRLDEFRSWAARVAETCLLVNPLALVRLSTHKSYLGWLAGLGIPVVPTCYLGPGAPEDLARTLEERGWRDAVVKPVVSLDSWGTFRVRAGEAPDPELVGILGSRQVMVQPYLASVEEPGERCLVCLDGEVSHAVRKRSLFLGGRKVGPEGMAVTASPAELAVARKVLALPEVAPAAYARVDLLEVPGQGPSVLELELVEPTLFLTDHPSAVGRLVAGLERRLAQARGTRDLAG